MTEAEIFADMAAHGDRVWSILQYWTSVSFGLLVAAHFAADQLNKYALFILLFLYSAFSFSLLRMLQFDQGMILAGIAQLRLMAENGAILSLLGENVIVTSPLATMTPFYRSINIFMGGGLYITSIVYPIYCYLKGRA